jgi:hypothetical protein
MSKTDLRVHRLRQKACFASGQLPVGAVPGLSTDLGLGMGSSVFSRRGFSGVSSGNHGILESHSPRFVIWAILRESNVKEKSLADFFGKTERYFYG